jgi:hypothetical protein
VGWKGQVVRTGLKTGTEDWLPDVHLWQCRCRWHGYFRVYTPFVLPNKHYAVVTVDAALDSVVQGTGVIGFCAWSGVHDPSTPRRWVAQWVSRLQDTAATADRWLRCMLAHWPGAVVFPQVRPPPAWTCESAWKHLVQVRADWPIQAHVPPLSYLALKA